MVQFAFNAQQFTPEFGGGGPKHPVGKKFLGIIVEDDVKPNKQAGTGHHLELTIECQEGPAKGAKVTYRLNLFHATSQKAVEIANKQLAGLCYVTGVFNIQDTAQLRNRPFRYDVDLQDANKPDGYVEVTAIYDSNGNVPGQSSGGQQQQAPAAPPPQGAPPPQQQQQQPPPQQYAPQQPQQPQQQAPQQPAPQPQGNGQGWGAPGAQQPPPQQPPQGGFGAAPSGGWEGR